MSHFSVIVVTEEGGPSVDSLLAPYVEEVYEGEEYAVFSREYGRKEAKEEMYREIDEIGKKLLTGDYVKMKDLRKRWKDSVLHKNRTPSQEDLDKEYGSKASLEEVLHEYISGGVDVFMERYYGYKYNQEHEAYGYWYNPSAKWDWYVIGGRWSGYFKAKIGRRGEMGQPGAFDNKTKPGYYDSIRVEDIDWEGIKRDAEAEAKKNWEESKGVDWKERQWKYGIAEGQTKKEYIKSQVEWSVRPYAFVDKDGEWYEKGRMGWFGIGHDEDEERYQKEWEELVGSLNPSDILTIVDCHI